MTMTLIALLVTLVLIGIVGIAITNSLWFVRLGRSYSSPEQAPSVSILIPARDEAGVITATLRALQAQTYGALRSYHPR